MNKYPLLIESTNLSKPEEINWNNVDLSAISVAVRWLFSILLLIISIVIASSLIAFCTLYVSSSSSCENFNAATTLISAVQAQGKTIFCYCSLHLTEIYTDASIGSSCGSLSNTILFTNALQIGASLVSSISNTILVIVVGLIAKYLLRPNTKPKEYSFIFVGVLLSNFINATLLPLIMNGDIFGVKSVSYLTFIQFLDFNQISIFKDFTTDWYAVISPYYLNMIIIASISPIIGLIIAGLKYGFKHWRIRSKCEHNDAEATYIQK
jgi:hypothetical protein